ncbi:MAG: S9 family peptidase [Ardenticatenaceae bacterium]|nr:S9 family peptidase [Anaerolineales bacterium]MCB8923884.1 S9 family peptidase [Ardenticatenaceae bacterium]MCB8990471.1 S9 family peptidase [Ardenticatenaceae bacterium]MCB9003485.1 S9 family peptidase [Ardenticatenaceae bacterium]
MSQHSPLSYPASRRVDVVDDYHGTAVPDPFRWLENPDTAETRAWIDAQNRLTHGLIDAVPQRPAIHQRLTELYNYPKFFTPVRKGAWLFFYKNDGLQNQAVLYRTQDLAGEAAVVLDPNTLTEDGTAAITSEAISKDGSHLAYGVSFGGSDVQEIRIRNVETGADYAETLHHCRFAGIAWVYDEAERPCGFYYNRYPDPDSVPERDRNAYNKLYWHRLDTPQAEDVLVYERPDNKELRFSPQITEDGRYLILYVWHAAIDLNRLYYRAVAHEGDFVRLVDEADASYQFVGSDGDTFFIQTNKDAANGRIVTVDLANPAQAQWRDVVPESDDIIAFTELVHQELVVVTMHNAAHQVQRFGLDGRPLGRIPLPELGAISGMTGKQASAELFFKFESFLNPGTVFRYDLAQNEMEVVWETAVSFNTRDYKTNQVFFPSKDGTRVSMFITYKKGLRLDGDSPVLLYGYGGFNISHTPAFAPAQAYWVESGGIFVDVNLRGGSEYGEAWHRAGMLENKQNVFDDFISAAEWLINNGYTRPERLAMMGRSNGGLLTSAVMLQRPDLFGAVLAIVPVTDMLRFHKFTAGRFWTAEYGNAEESAAQFRFMFPYSPLHNVQKGVAYPPILVTTADGDDRVVPLHAMKFTAALQTAVTQHHNPILIRIDTKSGHGLGKPTSKWIDEWADIFAFLQMTVKSDT